MNTATLAGRLVKDLDLRYTPNGVAVANGVLAVTRKFKNANGEYDSDFIDLVIWKKTAELMAQYCKKGDYFVVSGELTTRIWEKDDGSKQKVTEVNVQSFDFPVKPKQQQNNTNGYQYNQNQNSGGSKSFNDDPFSGGEPIDISDDDLPF
jgi:single-strand DNA-binding protein